MKETKLNNLLYKNKFFVYLKSKAETSYKSDFEKMGVSITNQENFEKTIEKSAIGTFWVFATIVLVIAYSIISPLV